ncbi:regulator of G-protein signaling 20-like [Thomomys bottae]
MASFKCLDTTVTVCWFLFLSFPHPAPALAAAGPAQFPGWPAGPHLFSLLSSSFCGVTRFFSHLLRRPPPAAPQRRSDSSPRLPALPAAGLWPGHELLSGRRLLRLGAALALSGRPRECARWGWPTGLPSPEKKTSESSRGRPCP